MVGVRSLVAEGPAAYAVPGRQGAHHPSLSLRDVEDILAERWVDASYETIRYRCLKLGKSRPTSKGVDRRPRRVGILMRW